MHGNLLVDSIIVIGILLLAFAAIKRLALHTFLPAEAWILIAGIAYGIMLKNTGATALPVVAFNPDVVLFIFLPLLIFASGRLIDLSELRAEGISIGFFAIVGVIVTSFIIGLPVSWALDIPLVHGLLIGAAAGATDPAAVAAIFHAFHIPERLGLLVEGESLFNDGTTVVLFTLISSLVISNGMFDVGGSLLEFGWTIIIAIPLGMAIGWLGAKLLVLLGEKQLFSIVSISLVITYAAFLVSEELLHVSGVIAVLMAAIFFIRTWRCHLNELDKKNSQEQLTIFKGFWEYIADIANSLLFFALGVATGQHDFQEVPFIAVAAAIISMLLARSVVIYGGSGLLNLARQGIPLRWQNVMYWGGLRGGVAAALILLIPEDYAYRGYFLCLAFAMISFSLIVQPAVLKFYLKRAPL